MTRAETERLVAALQPRPAPREGLRLLSSASPSSVALPRETPPTQQDPSTSTNPRAESPEASPPAPRPASRPTFEPVSASSYSLRVTVDAPFKNDLDRLKSLLAHKIPDGDLGAVLREAVQCALEKHGQRKGAVGPARERKSPQARKPAAEDKPRATAREPIPAAVRREVWNRDSGRCAWRSEDGRACGSTWKLELDHVVPAALGGPSTVENLRLCCRSHNSLHAERVYGRAHMERFRRERPRTGEITIPGGGEGEEVPALGEASSP